VFTAEVGRFDIRVLELGAACLGVFCKIASLGKAVPFQGAHRKTELSDGQLQLFACLAHADRGVVSKEKAEKGLRGRPVERVADIQARLLHVLALSALLVIPSLLLFAFGGEALCGQTPKYLRLIGT
jgi:hypothetical protein